MPPQPCLVLFATRHGQTGRIANRIAERLREHGIPVDVARVTDVPRPDRNGAAWIVVGGSVHGGRHQRSLVRWMRRNADVLNARATAVFSVSLSAHDNVDGAQQYLDRLLRKTGVRPKRTALFAGALRYGEYRLPTRWLMRTIARGQGLPTDTSTDVDLTDWAAVDQFADELASADADTDAGLAA